MRKVTEKEMEEILKKHQRLTKGYADGELAVLKNVYFQGVDLTNADLRGADLRGADFQGVILYKTKLDGAHLEKADLSCQILDGVSFSGADLNGVILSWADLRGVDLRGANLQGADLTGSDLRGAKLQKAFLEGANLRGANLQGANLEKATIRGAYIAGALFDGANLDGVCFTERQKAEISATKNEFEKLFNIELSPEILSLAQRVDDFMFDIAAPYDYLNEIGDAPEAEVRAENVRFLADSFRRGDTADMVNVITGVRDMMETENVDNTAEIENANQILASLAALGNTASYDKTLSMLEEVVSSKSPESDFNAREEELEL